jgi:MOSC domain-containing protein YiiM
MHVVSVQVGSPHTLQVGERAIETGIIKSPVDEILVNVEGIADDAVMNTKHHGGPDQAVYVYSFEDYEWWNQQLDRSLQPGTFGENLTVAGMPELVRVGDRLLIAGVLLEVAAPRIPCATFAARMGEPGWIRRFRDAGRSGFYCRVLEPGTIRTGTTVEWISAPAENISLAEMVDHAYSSDLPVADAQRAMASPIAHRARAQYQSRLP